MASDEQDLHNDVVAATKADEPAADTSASDAPVDTMADTGDPVISQSDNTTDSAMEPEESPQLQTTGKGKKTKPILTAEEKAQKKKEKKEKRKEQLRRSRRAVLRRTAGEVKRYNRTQRLIVTLSGVLLAIIAVVYAFSYFYGKTGSFTIKLNKYDMVEQGLTLSETSHPEVHLSRLDADIIQDITNISEYSLPENLENADGSHNGANYIAYTFYITNDGADTVTYRYSLDIVNQSKNIASAIRVRVYRNGEYVTYAKIKDDYSGPEEGTTMFDSINTVVAANVEQFAPKDQDKYTVVIWLEGNDPECVDSIIGGALKMEMNFEIVEGS